MPQVIFHSQIRLNDKPIEWRRSEDGESAQTLLRGAGRLYWQFNEVVNSINDMLNQKNNTVGVKFISSHYRTITIRDIAKIEEILNENFQVKITENLKEVLTTDVNPNSKKKRKTIWTIYKVKDIPIPTAPAMTTMVSQLPSEMPEPEFCQEILSSLHDIGTGLEQAARQIGQWGQGLYYDTFDDVKKDLERTAAEIGQLRQRLSQCSTSFFRPAPTCDVGTQASSPELEEPASRKRKPSTLEDTYSEVDAPLDPESLDFK